jgi:hypothetical protein
MASTDTVTAQGASSGGPRTRGGDFYLATSGDLNWPSQWEGLLGDRPVGHAAGPSQSAAEVDMAEAGGRPLQRWCGPVSSDE